MVVNAEQRIALAKGLRAWAGNGELRIERNDCSRLHRLIEAFQQGKIVSSNDAAMRSDWRAFFQDNHSFVVQHDWAAAFEGAGDFDDGAFRWPYDICSFEFRVNGKTVIAICFQEDQPKILNETNGIGCIIFFEQDGFWVTFGVKDRETIQGQFLWRHLRAVSIALDAEIATHTLVRAPHASNKKRESANRVPINDFHVISLARQSRGKSLNPSGQSDGLQRRLHFRRGHWRHFETHKTWIKWMLVGNPDLGFIAKEYRL